MQNSNSLWSPVSKTKFEKDLKALVMNKLVELKIVEIPVQTEPAVEEDGILNGET